MASPEPSAIPREIPAADLESLRRLIRVGVVNANDGIVANAGIVEGFYGAGASGTAIVIAAVSAMIAGGIAVAGAKYSEDAAELDSQAALIEEERRRLELAPEEEFAELVDIYEAKGLSRPLAQQVATELTERDALAAHADAEYGLPVSTGRGVALLAAAVAGFGFAGGAAVPLITALIAPNPWRVPITFAAVLVSLAITSLITAVTGRLHVLRTIIRTVAIGTSAMLITLLVGHLFHP